MVQAGHHAWHSNRRQAKPNTLSAGVVKHVPLRKTGSRCLPTLLALSVILLTLVACEAETTPADDTSIADSPKATPVAEVQDTSRMSLDDYLAICAGPMSGPIDAEFTLAGFATVLGQFTKQLEAVEPPEEVAAWHDAVLVYQRVLKKALDDAPGPGEGKSEDEYILSVLFPVALQHQPEITEAIKGMDRDLVASMLEAGCIDGDTLSMNLTAEEMKELGVGTRSD